MITSTFLNCFSALALVVRSPAWAASIGSSLMIQDSNEIMPIDAVNVPVTLGVMSRCPDALACEAVFDNVLDRVGAKVDIDLSFVGRINVSEPIYGVTCLHGPLECAGNIHELCTMAHVPSQKTWWAFLHCVNYEGRTKIGPESVSRRCAKIVGIDWEESGVASCVNDGEGLKLLKKSVSRSARLGIEKSCTIIINHKIRCIRDETWKDCDGGHTPADFISRINNDYEKLNSRRHYDRISESDVAGTIDDVMA